MISEPFNGFEKGHSIADGSAYGIQFDGEGRNKLTNLDYPWFTIDEMEVWSVTGAEPVQE